MKRALLVGSCVAWMWTAVLPANAGPSDPFEAQYEGRVERDPSTWLGFEVVRRDGERKVGGVTALLRYNCDNGDGGLASARARGRLRVNSEGRFEGKLEGDEFKARGTGSSVTYELAGRLGSRGRARGTIDGVLRFREMTRGGGFVRCYSGELDWRARRGADTDPIFGRDATVLR